MAKLINLIPTRINEAADTDIIVKKIAKLTDRNDHTEAAIVLAKFLKDNKNLKVLTAIQSIHDALNHMPVEISKFRTQIKDALLDDVKKKYGNDVYKSINGSF